MPRDPVADLAALSRSFGPGTVARKRELLDAVAALPRLPVPDLRLLQDTLNFMQAYPDSAAILDRVRRCIGRLLPLVRGHRRAGVLPASLLNSGLPGTDVSHVFSYDVVRRLAATDPGSVEIDWDDVEDDLPLSDAVSLIASPAEGRGLDDETLGMREWLETCGRGDGRTHLETVLRWLERAPLSPAQRAHVFDACELPVLLSLDAVGRGRIEAVARPGRIHYQRRPVPRERFPLPPRIRGRLDGSRRLSAAAGGKRLALAVRALCTRNLEIYPLVHADPERVTVAPCGRGLEVTLAAVRPTRRTVPESLFFFLVQKNGVPVAYGPASVFLGCCEMGINLFPEFRGGEIRFLYAQFMRVLYHVALARYFYVVPYGMGEDNPEALASGAFWFYRRLGFRPSNPRVEALARREEAVMKRRPGYRSPRSVLRRLSHTHAVLDLSGGTVPRFDYAGLGRRVTRLVDSRYGGDRERARRGCVRRLVRVLDIGNYGSWGRSERTAMGQLAPFLCIVPGLAGWSARERRALAAAVRARGSDEFAYLRGLMRVPRLAGALVEAVGESPGGSEA